MTSLIGRFMRDLPFLREGMIPQEESGAEVTMLDYTGEEHEKLTDDDINELSQALCCNNKFQGELKLNSNDLSDLAALHLSKVFEKQDGNNVTKLKLDGNCFTSRAGEYLGHAIGNNASYPIVSITFTGICLEDIGLTRMIEAVNCNTNIKRLDIGILTDAGLKAVSQLLACNTTLESITIQETKDHQKLWTAEGREAFSNLLCNGTKIKRVSLHFTRENEDADN